MYIISKNYDPAHFRDINQILVRHIYKADNRCYEEYYRKTYSITIMHGYITYKEVGEIILFQYRVPLLLPKKRSFVDNLHTQC
jgi:hypothetical protein